jgi:hypothetical protein
MKKALAYLTIITMVCAPTVTAQVAQEFEHLVGGSTSVWKFTHPSNHHEAVVRVAVGKASGTGTIVHVDRQKPSGSGYQGYCLTAYHVVRDRPEADDIVVYYPGGGAARNCQVVAFDSEYDVALLWVWVPQKQTAVEVASVPVVGLDVIEFCGLGGNSKLKCCLRSFNATAALPTHENQLYADVSLLPGDSGGPVFNQNRQVVGVISGGWFWWEAGVKDKGGSHVMATWPARAANATVLKKLLAQVAAIPPTGTPPEMQVASSE